MEGSKGDSAAAHLVEKLALESVMADEDGPGGPGALSGLLESVSEAAAEEGLGALSRSAAAMLECLRDKAGAPGEDISGFIARGVDVLRRAACAGMDEEEAEALILECAGVSRPPSSVLSDSQRGEFGEFIRNASEAVDEIESRVLSLSKGCSGSPGSVLRILHTIKGEAGIIGVSNLGALAHGLEGFLERAGDGDGGLCEETESLVLESLDIFRGILNTMKFDPDAALSRDVSGLLEKMGSARPEGPGPEQDAGFSPSVPELDLEDGGEIINEFINEARDEHLERAERSLLNIESSPGSREDMDNLFRAFHTLKGLASFLGLEDIRLLAHETETLMDLVRKDRLKMREEISEAVFNSIDGMRKLLGLLGEQVRSGGRLQGPYYDAGPVISALVRLASGTETAPPPPAGPRLGEIMVSQNLVTDEDVESALEKQSSGGPGKRIGEVLVESEAATQSQVDRALRIQKEGGAVQDSLRITLDKLDHLIETAGELAITGSLVAENPLVKGTGERRLSKDVERLGLNIRDIQNTAMSMRLVPIRPVFRKMVRLARDLSKKSGKKVDVNLYGEDTELDKKIIELIGDPLMHMVRNSVDHGIEPQDERASAGKPRNGRVQLSASHRGGKILVELEDDGRGLDEEKILAKARSRGLVGEGEAPDSLRIQNMIFEPGFSTAEQVTDVSGRGVGMDVVKRNIEQLRGSIEVSSRPGEGTRFSVSLPLTMAVIEGIVLAVGEERYIAPIYSISEFIRLGPEDISTVEGRGEMIINHGGMCPLVRLDRLFEVRSGLAAAGGGTGCMADSENGRFCLMVDDVLGQHQVVLKNLGSGLERIKGISGGAILGNGRVGLILDMNGIASVSAAQRV